MCACLTRDGPVAQPVSIPGRRVYSHDQKVFSLVGLYCFSMPLWRGNPKIIEELDKYIRIPKTGDSGLWQRRDCQEVENIFCSLARESNWLLFFWTFYPVVPSQFLQPVIIISNSKRATHCHNGVGAMAYLASSKWMETLGVAVWVSLPWA